MGHRTNDPGAFPEERPAPPASIRTPKPNDEFIYDLMRFGNPMKQLVILEAVRRYVAEAAKMDPDAQDQSKWAFISAHAWRDAAVEIRDAFAERGLSCD